MSKVLVLKLLLLTVLFGADIAAFHYLGADGLFPYVLLCSVVLLGWVLDSANYADKLRELAFCALFFGPAGAIFYGTRKLLDGFVPSPLIALLLLAMAVYLLIGIHKLRNNNPTLQSLLLVYIWPLVKADEPY